MRACRVGLLASTLVHLSCHANIKLLLHQHLHFYSDNSSNVVSLSLEWVYGRGAYSANLLKGPDLRPATLLCAANIVCRVYSTAYTPRWSH